MNTNTGALNIPSGTTAQRPATPRVGMLRYNTSTSKNEVYIDTAWANITTTAYPYTGSYLLVAGGGGGSDNGGGGAGGFLTGTTSITPGTKESSCLPKARISCGRKLSAPPERASRNKSFVVVLPVPLGI